MGNINMTVKRVPIHEYPIEWKDIYLIIIKNTELLHIIPNDTNIWFARFMVQVYAVLRPRYDR